MAKGIIYVMTSAVNGLIKIGKTETKQFSSRMSFLQNNGYFNVANLVPYFAIEVDDYSRKEKLLHTIFSKSQVSNSEMFALDKHIVRELLLSFTGTIIYDRDDSTSRQKSHKTVRHPAPSFRFSMIGLKSGDKIHYVHDDNIIAVVSTDKSVMYQNQEYSLSALARKLMSTDKALQGPRYFTYGGKTLDDLRHMNGN